MIINPGYKKNDLTLSAKSKVKGKKNFGISKRVAQKIR
jgi:hypothetical protein